MWEYMAKESERAEGQRARMADAARRHWLVWAALAFGVVGAIFFGMFFRTERTETETSGHLWWKDETVSTTDVPMGTRLIYLFIGLALILAAAWCAYLQVRRNALRKSQRKYLAILAGVERIKIHQLAGITNHPTSVVYRDIQRMMDAGLIDDVHIDYQAEEVVSKKYVPKSSFKSVVTCSACGVNNEVIVGIPRPCVACGETLVLNIP